MEGDAAILTNVAGPFAIREYPLPEVKPNAIIDPIGIGMFFPVAVYRYMKQRKAATSPLKPSTESGGIPRV
jgi:hypothetical protein